MKKPPASNNQTILMVIIEDDEEATQKVNGWVCKEKSESKKGDVKKKATHENHK